MKLGKWIGLGLGWSLMPPLGAIIGFFVGSYFDSQSADPQIEKKGRSTQRGDFMMSLMVLIAAVMKADGKIVKSELNYVQTYLKNNFGIAAAQEGSVLLRDLVKQDLQIRDVCMQIGRRLDYSSRLQMLHFLFGLAAADGEYHQAEVRVIEDIASFMGVRNTDFTSIKSMFVKDTNNAYRILGVDKNDTLDDIKRVYRKMAKENHPDKVAYLGDDIRKKAEEKFQKINDAYEQIKKERGIN